MNVGGGGVSREEGSERRKRKSDFSKKKDKRGCRRENVKETSAFDERQLKKEEGRGGGEGHLGRLLLTSVAVVLGEVMWTH